MLPQSNVMITAEVVPERLQSLRQLLASMNEAPGLADPHNELIPFYQFEQLHFARFVIVESDVSEDLQAYSLEPRPWPPTLALLADFDGSRETFLAELAVRAGPGLAKIFAHCEGFEESEKSLLSWMLPRNIRPAANYINYLGRTVRQVRQEKALHASLRQRLSELTASESFSKPESLLESLRAHTDSQLAAGSLELSPAPKTPLRWRLANLCHLLLPPLVLILLAPVLILLLPFFFIALRIHERRDPEIVPRPDPDKVNSLAGLEDQIVSNQFSAFGDVKPGLFRRYTLIVLLFALDYAARHIYRRGYLTRVQSIHFARWVLLDDKRRLLFASNYDGSLESYMDDFINKVAWGLNLVFSNGIGYPRTRWLIKDGAEQEQKFKNYLRRHQVYTDVWYKAYPDATAFELKRNTRIRKGLESGGFRNSQAIRAWLALI